VDWSWTGSFSSRHRTGGIHICTRWYSGEVALSTLVRWRRGMDSSGGLVMIIKKLVQSEETLMKQIIR
jgi:hypothetical protein